MSNAVYVTRTRPIDEIYHEEEAAVIGAIVTLQREGSGRLDTLAMGEAGRYANPSIVIGSKQTYRLAVDDRRAARDHGDDDHAGFVHGPSGTGRLA